MYELRRIIVKQDNRESYYYFSQYLLSHYNKIFKGLLEAVYFEIWEASYLDNHGKEDIWHRYKARYKDLDRTTKLLVFKNGAIVKFWNSEYAELTNVEIKKED